MVTRTVTVRLRADISNYTRNMRQASDNTSRLANGGAAAGAALLAGFAVAAAAAAKFDKALSNVRAVTGASTAEMSKLRAAALEAGKTTSFTATEAANAEAELARAGISTANIIGGALKGSLALAASGQVSLGEAAVVSAQAMNTFGLAGQDVTHIADLLAAGANKSAADVHGLSMSLRMGGLLAHQTGLSIEDTVGTLAAFADHALIGSDAGTSLKVMLQRLVPQSKEAQGAMDAIGFSAYDSTGKFVGLSELAGRMKTSFSKLTPEARNSAMATIFGADAVRSATILYQLGSEGIDKYVKSVDDSGAAQRMAAVQTDNLVGDLERLRGALEVALIEGGSAANESLRTMTQWITRLVNAYNGLPPELQHAVTGFMGVGGAVAFVAGGILLLLPRIAATRIALASMGVTATTVRGALMGLGRMSIVTAGLAAMVWSTDKLTESLRDAPPNVTKMTNALVDFAAKGKATGELSKAFGKDLDGIGEAAARLAHPGTLDRVGDSLYAITHLGMSEDAGLESARDKLTAIDEALAALVQSGAADVAAENFSRFAAEAEKGGTSTEKFRSLLPGYTEALTSADTQTKLAGDSQGELGDETKLTADEMQDQRTEAEKLSDALKTLNGVAIGAAEGEIGFRSSLADLTSAVKENGHSLDVTTEKGRNVKGAFLDAAKAAMSHAEAVAAQSGSVEAGNAVLEQDIAVLKQTMHQAGFTDDQIRKLTASFAQLPANAATKVSSPGAAKAAADLAELREKVMAIPPGKSINVKAPTGPAIKALEAAGYSVKKIPGTKEVKISAPTGSAVANAQALKRALDRLVNKSITVTSHYVKITENRTINTGSGGRGPNARANGGIIRRYAGGGDVVQSWPVGGPIVGPGTGTSDSIPALVSNGEYVVKAAAVRRYGVAMFDRLNAMRYASGGGVGFTYTPTSAPALGGPSDARGRFDDLVAKLRAAWTEYEAARKELDKVRKNKRSTKAQRSAAEKKVRDEFADVKELDKALGLPAGAKAPTTLNLNAYQKQLTASVAATEKWRANLAKIGKRGGAEVQALLEAMGEEGYSLVNALAGASDKQFKDIAAKLLKTGEIAKASLADFTKQVDAATKTNSQFASDLQALAARGFGDLAQALAAQGDSNAQALARQAVTGGAAVAAQANAAVGKASSTLSGEDLSNALVLLTTLRGGAGRGYTDLIAAGLDTATIRALVPKMLAQINSLPEANKSAFLKQFAGQTGITAMARGAILGSPTVLAGEAGVPEAYIPINGSARSRALLATTARMLGYDARPAGRFASAGGGGSATHYDQRTTSLTLNGAKQSSAEQAADIVRHLTFIG
ncbi:phage tail tape measure protein [Streptomyces sp. NPDC058391]|uniref:phage tail tape measure protein n=1 Tax=Streptomyces sp. NPDC058391 TaxID=3346476 RepID=UPI00364704D9